MSEEKGEQQLSYYKRNKAKFDARRQRKIECSACGRHIQVSSLTYHKKSKLCINTARLNELEKSGEVEVV